MKDKVTLAGTVSTRNIIASSITGVSEEAVSELGSIPVLARNIRNWRQRDSCFPTLPTIRTGFEIPDEFKFLDDE